MTFTDVMDAISDTLAEADPTEVARIHNLVCSKRIVAIQGSASGYGKGPRYDYAPEKPILTQAQRNFFEAELRNDSDGPDTLESAVDSLLQAPPEVIASWAKIPTDSVDDFANSIERLWATYGGDMKLTDLL